MLIFRTAFGSGGGKDRSVIKVPHISLMRNSFNVQNLAVSGGEMFSNNVVFLRSVYLTVLKYFV